MKQATESVAYEITGKVGLIALHNPPVNAASHDLRLGLLNAVTTLQNDDAVQAIAIYGTTRAFIAGADIREFGKPSRDPMLPAVCLALENCPKPVIAVLHGPTLGGGLEVALATHARIARSDTIVGFPEVTLGIIPGAGGTQRAPRLIGIAATLALATTGHRIGAKEALKLGLVDRITDGEPREIALDSARDVLAGTLATRRTCDLTTPPDQPALDKAAETLAKTQPHLFSPHKCVQAVAASTRPLPDGLARERALFQECINSPQRAGLIHAFFAERAVAKFPEQDATPHEIRAVGVIGGGTMGSGIATALLLSGLSVTLAERDAEALVRGRTIIETNLEGAVKRHKLSPKARDAILAEALHATTDLRRLDHVDLVIEAVFEDMEVKQSLFRQLDKICKPGAVLATNTSYLNINEIADVTQRARDVIGLHFFSPAHIMRLLEVVVADQTAPETVATGFALAKRLGKVAVRAGVCDGFIGNRILAHYRKAADYMVLDGADPQQVDQAMQEFGFAMGPFAVSDLAGLDIGWATRKRKAIDRPMSERYATFADRMCEHGWFGRKTGQGFYIYGEGKPRPNPKVIDIIHAERKEKGIIPRNFSNDEIVDRYMAAMVSEATRVVAEGIALRPIDVDAVFLFGYGFPRHRGGPMHYADSIGAAELISRIETYAKEDRHFWQVPALLRQMAESGQKFADLNKAQ